MTKIMLVEDDKSLREIYGVRLLAEGYDIVSAGDGEEALAVAIKERPQLIISDVMMPKVSGYDMLDILRSTTETKNIRVIMMTALSSDEQRTRAESLGADRYLVKSQVGIEDVVRVVHEVLEDKPSETPSAPVLPTPSAPAPTPSTPPAPSVAPTIPAPVAPVAQVVRPAITPTPQPASLKSRFIEPLNDPRTSPVDLNQLLDQELAKEAGITDDARPPIATANQTKDMVSEQLNNFQPPVEPTPVETESVAVPADPLVPVGEGTSVMPSPGITPYTPPSLVTPSTPPEPPQPIQPVQFAQPAPGVAQPTQSAAPIMPAIAPQPAPLAPSASVPPATVPPTPPVAQVPPVPQTPQQL